MAHVVSVANVGELDFADIAELLFESEKVGQCLAGMLEIAESIDDRYIRIAGHVFDRGVRERTEHGDVDPALDILSDVVQAFASVKASVRLVDEHRSPA